MHRNSAVFAQEKGLLDGVCDLNCQALMSTGGCWQHPFCNFSELLLLIIGARLKKICDAVAVVVVGQARPTFTPKRRGRIEK